MTSQDDVLLASQELLRRMAVRYTGSEFAIFAFLTGVFAVFSQRVAGMSSPVASYIILGCSIVMGLTSLIFLIHPPVKAGLLGIRLACVVIGIHLLLLLLDVIGVITLPEMLQYMLPVTPIALGIAVWRAVRFRRRFGDREPERTPPALRKMLSREMKRLVHVKPSRHRDHIFFAASDTSSSRPKLEFWHGWLSPEGYILFAIYSNPVVFSEDQLLAFANLLRVEIYPRDTLTITPTEKKRFGQIGVQIGLETRVIASAVTRQATLDNLARWAVPAE